MTAALSIKSLPLGRLALVSVLALAALAGCAEREIILPGERLDPRADVIGAGGQVEGMAVATKGVGLSLPGARANSDWTQRGGNGAHDAGHVALGGGLTRVWSAGIGQPAGKRHRITADPVVAGGLVFALDSRARVTAVSAGGGTVWSTDITAPGESGDSASGGGLAWGEGKVFATTGFGELVALDAASGAVLWRQRVRAPIGGAPAYADGLVYVVGRDATAWAVRAGDGKVEWTAEGTPSATGVMGVAAPAVDARMVVFPFASGEVMGTLRQGGMKLWSTYVAGARPGRAYGAITDMTGEPVIRGGVVYTANATGRIAAVSAASGEPLWTAPEGAMSPVSIAGGSLFLVNDQGQLVRLDADTGARIWAVDLPFFTTTKVKKQKAIHPSFGPVLAGGRLFVASGDGLLRAFDPVSGVMTGSAEIPGGAASAPVVAGQTLYVVGRGGQLHAYR